MCLQRLSGLVALNGPWHWKLLFDSLHQSASNIEYELKHLSVRWSLSYVDVHCWNQTLHGLFLLAKLCWGSKEQKSHIRVIQLKYECFYFLFISLFFPSPCSVFIYNYRNFSFTKLNYFLLPNFEHDWLTFSR